MLFRLILLFCMKLCYWIFVWGIIFLKSFYISVVCGNWVNCLWNKNCMLYIEDIFSVNREDGVIFESD